MGKYHLRDRNGNMHFLEENEVDLFRKLQRLEARNSRLKKILKWALMIIAVFFFLFIVGLFADKSEKKATPKTKTTAVPKDKVSDLKSEEEIKSSNIEAPADAQSKKNGIMDLADSVVKVITEAQSLSKDSLNNSVKPSEEKSETAQDNPELSANTD